MFECAKKTAFASYTYFQKIRSAGFDADYIEELWVPDAENKQVLLTNKFKCSKCGLQSKPGTLPINASEVPAKIAPWVAVFNDYHKFPGDQLRLASGLMDVCSIDGNQITVCWVCRGAMCPALSVVGIKAHGVAIFCPDVAQEKISQLAISEIFAKKSTDTDLAVCAENTLMALRNALVPQVERIIPGLTNGSVEDLSHKYYELPEAVHQATENHFAAIKYIPNASTYNMHMTYWFNVLSQHPALKAINNG